MRVISGSAKGRKLKTLDGLAVRPTTDKVKEAIFSALQFDLPEATVLDLFAGSGQMGIEALSRGAKSVVFVDHAARSLAVVRENLMAVGFLTQAQIYQMEAATFLTTTNQVFDVVILDPPYHHDILAAILPLLENVMAYGGRVVCEHETGLQMAESFGTLQQEKQRKYGAITVTTYRCGRGDA